MTGINMELGRIFGAKWRSIHVYRLSVGWLSLVCQRAGGSSFSDVPLPREFFIEAEPTESSRCYLETRSCSLRKTLHMLHLGISSGLYPFRDAALGDLLSDIYLFWDNLFHIMEYNKIHQTSRHYPWQACI